MTEAMALKRQATAFEVLSLIYTQGYTKEKACEEVGISVRSYDYWIANDPEFIPALRLFIDQLERANLANLNATKYEAFRMFLNDLTDPTIHVRDRIAIWKSVVEPELERLTREHHAVPGAEERAHDVLAQLPDLSTAKSRVASISILPDDLGGIQVNIDKLIEVIDIDPESLEEEDN